jgi:hypothetical protein
MGEAPHMTCATFVPCRPERIKRSLCPPMIGILSMRILYHMSAAVKGEKGGASREPRRRCTFRHRSDIVSCVRCSFSKFQISDPIE